MIPPRVAARLPFLFAVVALPAMAGCGSPWTARMCASNASGNCRAVDTQGHPYTVKSTGVGPVQGLNDVMVREPACANGIGEVDVQVVDHDDLQVTFYCLDDAPKHTMTLGSAAPAPSPPPAAPDASAPPASSH